MIKSLQNPPVTVVCLCHNHAPFVKEAIDSVTRQTYPNIQLIVVDDASTDGSPGIIEKTLEAHPTTTFISLSRNHGNCSAFNKTISRIEGEYVIDLAADDVLLPERVQEGINAMDGGDCAVNFSDAEIIDEHGGHLGYHSDRFVHAAVPQGDVYCEVVRRYFICPPTVMFRRNVLLALGGYDETLAYEDFDFWVRAARHFLFCYTPRVLVKKRVVQGSLTHRQHTFTDAHIETTLRVCKKAAHLNRTSQEWRALQARLFYETGHSLKHGQFGWFFRFGSFWLGTMLKSRQQAASGTSAQPHRR